MTAVVRLVAFAAALLLCAPLTAIPAAAEDPPSLTDAVEAALAFAQALASDPCATQLVLVGSPCAPTDVVERVPGVIPVLQCVLLRLEAGDPPGAVDCASITLACVVFEGMALADFVNSAPVDISFSSVKVWGAGKSGKGIFGSYGPGYVIITSDYTGGQCT